MEKGYTLVKIHEVWHFPPEQRRTGLFADYVNTWLKLKQGSAAWPSWCQTVEQKREYILRYKEREGINFNFCSHILKMEGFHWCRPFNSLHFSLVPSLLAYLVKPKSRY